MIYIIVNNNCSILAVGWDKHVNVFHDDHERLKQICFPEDQFGGDDLNEGHKEDILCIDKSQGDLIATGDYGGTIIVWNMSSKKIFAILKENQEKNQHSEGKISKKKKKTNKEILNFILPFFSEENLNDRVVSRLTFIDSRFGRRDVANLISGGPYGHIHFWNIYKNGVLMAKFRPVNIFSKY